MNHANLAFLGFRLSLRRLKWDPARLGVLVSATWHCVSTGRGQMQYCYYASTFISVKEASKSERRSQSCPPMQQQDGRHESEKNYVSKLQERAFSLSFLNSTPHDSKGSFGHPEFCRRPCLFMKLPAGCPKGAECEYCHQPHSQGVKFDKRQREILQSMGERELLTFLLPALRTHAKTTAAKEVLVLVEQHLAALQAEPSRLRIPSGKLNQLKCLLRRMSFRRLMLLCPCRHLEHIQTALQSINPWRWDLQIIHFEKDFGRSTAQLAWTDGFVVQWILTISWKARPHPICFWGLALLTLFVRVLA